MTRKEVLPFAAPALDVDLNDGSLVWVRSAWSREGDAWRLRMFEAVTGSEPSGWPEASWDYPQISFRADTRFANEVGDWFRNRKIRLDNFEHELPQIDINRPNWERRESRALTSYGKLDWPADEAILAGNLEGNEPNRPLLSDSGAPSFASFYDAAVCFFGLRRSTSNSLPASAVFRSLDTRARINRVEIAEDLVRVEVEGDALNGLTVELAGDTPGQAQTLEAKGRMSTATVSFPLSDGLPSGAWVVIRSGSEWRDRRFLTWQWTQGQETDVTVEVSPKTKLEAFTATRESDTVEFKQSIPEAESTKAKVMKTVAAFANGDGGSLLFGITDDYEVIGLPEAKASKHKDTLSDLVDAWIEPTPSYSFDILPIEGTAQVVIELIVRSGPALYALAKPNETHKIYVRHHSRSVPARVREIEAIAQARSNAARFRYPHS